jgi:hypothetical protein
MDSLMQFTEVSVRLFVFFMLSNIVNWQLLLIILPYSAHCELQGAHWRTPHFLCTDSSFATVQLPIEVKCRIIMYRVMKCAMSSCPLEWGWKYRIGVDARNFLAGWGRGKGTTVLMWDAAVVVYNAGTNVVGQLSSEHIRPSPQDAGNWKDGLWVVAEGPRSWTWKKKKWLGWFELSYQD